MIKVSSKILLWFIFASIFLASCSSVKKGKSDININELQPLNSSLHRLEANCLISSTMNNQSFNFRVKVNISGTDSVSMIVYGPFGITVGRLYSDLEKFQFHNIMENTVYTGVPSQENIKKATNLSISIQDFLNLFQGKTPFRIDEYRNHEADNKRIIIKRTDKANFGDFAVLDAAKMNLVRYQRKDKGDVLILDSSFDNFKSFGDIALPSGMNFNMPTVDGKMIVEVENFKINNDASLPEKFNIPASVKIVDLNTL